MQVGGSAPHLSIDKIEQAGHQQIGKGHKINNPVVDPFRGLSIGLALNHSAAHGTLGIRQGRKRQKEQQ